MKRPDLHLHSTFSDGECTPYELARRIQQAEVTLFSLTDHDTMTGLAEASDAAYERGLAFLPGVEISAEAGAEVHILGYGVDANDPVLTTFFSQMAKERIDRFWAMGQKLRQEGFGLELDEILKSAGNSVGRPHLARALMEMGAVRDMQEAFERLLGAGCPCYVPRKKLNVSKAIQLLRQRGAVPVLAHPGLIDLPIELLLPLIHTWQDAGLMGIEVYHPANRSQYSQWDRLARQRKLLVTGGSDYHGPVSNHGQIGETIDEWPSACDDAWALFHAAQSRS